MGFFHHSSDLSDISTSKNVTCPDKTLADPVQVPILNGLNFHQVTIIISGACMAFSCLVSFFLIMKHATHFSLPKEQKQIIRIIFMVPVFSIISFLSVTFDGAAMYLRPVDDLYEGLALACFFLLLCAYIREDDDERQNFVISAGVTKQYTFATIGAFQFPVVELFLLVVTEIAQATGSYCSTSNSIHFAHLWLELITVATTTIAVMSVLKFYSVLKPTIYQRHPLSKLVAFKGIVFLNFVQNTLFSFLISGSHLHPTTKYTFKDLSIGVPNLLTSIEMVFFSLIFLYVYRVTEYNYKTATTAAPLDRNGYQGGPLGIKALFEALNIFDLVKAMFKAPKQFSANGGRKGKVWVTGDQETQYETVEMIPETKKDQYGRDHPTSYSQAPAFEQNTTYNG